MSEVHVAAVMKPRLAPAKLYAVTSAQAKSTGVATANSAIARKGDGNRTIAKAGSIIQTESTIL